MNKKTNIVKTASTKEKRVMFSLFHNEAIMISVIYAVFGILWILLSDRILKEITPDMEAYIHFQTYKGWFYILITTLMVYFLIRDRMLRLKNENKKTLTAYDNLNLAHTELKNTKAELLYQKELTDSIINEAPVFIIAHDEEKLISFNPYAQRVCGYTMEDITDKNWLELIVPAEYHSSILNTLKEIRDGVQLPNYEFPFIKKDGSIINILWNSSLVSQNKEDDGYFVTIGADINERKRYEEKITQLAFYDTLTGLPNRAKFENEVNRQLSRKVQDDHFMIAYIDIDNFKNINDSMGHQVGDLFLTYLGERLKEEVKEPNFVARLGGDEYAILFVHMLKEDVLKKLDEIKDRINRTWTIENRQFYISMSVGVVAYPSDGESSGILLRNADIAMYNAKREGKNRILFYNEDINRQNINNVKMINNLQYGIDEGQFVLYYQPQFNLNTGDITGVEALVRWIHPEEGFIPPSDFIPLAEESGQIFKLEQLIIANALKQKKEWERQGHRDLTMSINLSGKTLTSSINFKEIEKIITESEVDLSKVMFEITETANISDVDIVINHLNNLRKQGIRIALDDFGTGYSSLNYLKKFPINIVKLDRSFINAINENVVDMLLIKNILTLVHDLEFQVIAEGIETRDQLEFLKHHFCEEGQGYLFSKPLPIDKMNMLLADNYHFI